MSEIAANDIAAPGSSEQHGKRWRVLSGSWGVFHYLVVMAAGWFLLKELAPLLRPLLLAIFLAYVILPASLYVKGQVRGGVFRLAILVCLGVIGAGLLVLAYGDLVSLTRDIPDLATRVQQIVVQLRTYAGEQSPWLAHIIDAGGSISGADAWVREQLKSLANMTAGVLIEAVEVAFFLILILVESGRFPRRMRSAFAGERAEQILGVVTSINQAIAQSLKVKVKVSAVLAVPVMLVLYGYGIKYVVLWGILTFFANFVPYLGSIVACTLPVLFGFLTLDFGWQPITAAVLLISIHTLSAYLVEPAMTGKAVDLSPLVVLIALSFWGLCWGLVGMVLAVPLTAMIKIILESVQGTRPFGKLMGGE